MSAEDRLNLLMITALKKIEPANQHQLSGKLSACICIYLHNFQFSAILKLFKMSSSKLCEIFVLLQPQ